jgi:endoglucanase
MTPLPPPFAEPAALTQVVASVPTFTPGPRRVATNGPTLPVGKCINLSDMLDAPTEGAWGPPVSDEDARILRSAGFSTVRIPVNWSAHAQQESPYAIDPAFLERVRHVVDLMGRAGLNVILDLHAEAALMSDPMREQPRFIAIWDQIGRSFAAAPPSVWLELLNEPHGDLTATNLWALLAPALATVRGSNPTRPVLIDGPDWGSLKGLEALQLSDDPFLVPTFHYYEPFDFTHQGATWVEHPPAFGRSYGTLADIARLQQDLESVKAYMRRTGRAPVMGEFGAQDDPRVPLSQRLLYYRTISAAFASVGVQSCAWGYRQGFRLRSGDGWLPGALDALVAPAP